MQAKERKRVMDLLKVILPVIVMLMIGMLCREKKLISPEGSDGL